MGAAIVSAFVVCTSGLHGAVQGAAESVCPEPPGTAVADLPSYVSPVPVTYVLEVPAGWLAHYGLGVGTPVEGLPSPAE